MANFEKMDVSTLVSALVGILVIMISSIFYFSRKQNEELSEEELVAVVFHELSYVLI